jgi:glyoxylase-like metal-dependent hydrolase (beta-lactamase superfamily II)
MTTSLTIGDYEITAVLDGPSTARDPGTIFTEVPADAWDPYRSFALTADGKWQPDWRSHLIRSTSGDGPKILVDAGMGDVVHEHTGERGKLLENLAALGVQPEDIDIVVTTHCHGDHIGWNVAYDGDTPSLTFPNATHWVASQDWEHYSKTENENPAFDKSVKPLESLGALKLIGGVEQLAPGISTLPTNGHTPGHQCILIESDGLTAVITGDLFHSVVQVTEQSWCPTFDWNTAMSTQSRKSLLSLALTQEWIVFTGHLTTGSSIGNVVSEGGKSVWKAL